MLMITTALQTFEYSIGRDAMHFAERSICEFLNLKHVRAYEWSKFNLFVLDKFKRCSYLRIGINTYTYCGIYAYFLHFSQTHIEFAMITNK